jgi:S-(hydroxymethyl)glutathione dehydrogenase/alcohol dehydrogenase
MGCSTFSEYTVMPEISVAKVNPAIDHANACLLGCGVSTGYGAATITAKVEKGAKVAIFGAGGVGLAVMRGCVEAGASMIIAIDTNPKKEEIARKFGATHFLNPKELESGKTIQAKLIEMTEEDGFGGCD